MRKFALLVLIIMLIGIPSSRYFLNTSNQYDKMTTATNDPILSSNLVTWHHDCSNTTGWYLDPDPPQVRLNGIQDDVDLLSDGTSISSSSIPYASGRWHGSVFFYELPSSFLLGQGLSLTVQLNHPGSLDNAGGMEVGLYDQYKNITCWVSIVDSWYSGAFITDLGYYENGISLIQSTSRSGSLISIYKVWHDETTNTLKGHDNQGTYTLANENQFNPVREIHYVGLMFWNVEDYTYESNQVLDILIESKISPSSTTTTSTTSETTRQNSIHEQPSMNIRVILSVGIVIECIIIVLSIIRKHSSNK
ncbi:MAG: hypothetical protein ACFFDQ_11345 [Candidatus Thorarchaeota archaeon]